MKWYALDYVDDTECELVCGDQLYATEEAAEAARKAKEVPSLYEVSWYGYADLVELYDGLVQIDEHLQIHPSLA